jgi:FkbM family methyltransferase
MKSILDLLPRPFPRIEILDLGAMALGDGAAYQRLLDLDVASVVGFEPVAAECEKLNRTRAATHRYFPHVIGDGARREFRECNYPTTSSLYEPDLELCGLFQSLGELMQVTSRSAVSTVRLDDIVGLPRFDYVKMDIQGAELDAIRGGAHALSHATVIETEVEFVPLYRDQPLFGDVDAALRGLGFLFHKFRSLSGRALKPIVVNGDPNAPLSQQLWANAVYVAHPKQLRGLSPLQLLKMAVVMHEVYSALDFAHLALAHHAAQTGSSFATDYLRAIGAA